jgi:transcriptional regulator with XRE-family HTH domain
VTFEQRIGAVLRQLRRERALTADGVSAQLGYSRGVVSQWERGERNFDVDDLFGLAAIYEMRPGFLLSLLAVAA